MRLLVQAGRKIGILSGIILVPMLGGCAHLPDATVNYYLAQSKASFKVIRTVTCDKDDHVVLSNAVTPAVTHSADRTGDPLTIPLAKLRGTYSDTDVKIERYDDGRLKSINATNTGEGEAILKTAVAIAGGALGFGGKSTAHTNVCADIKLLGDGKPITLIYEGDVAMLAGNVGKEQTIEPDAATKVIVDAHKLESAIGHVCAIFEKGLAPETVPAVYTPPEGVKFPTTAPEGSDVLLWMREPGRAKIKIKAGGANSCQQDSIWEDEVSIAQFGTTYSLPIPAPAAFGKGTLAVTLAESGALTSMQFVSNTGAGQLLNVIGAGQAATAGPTTAQQAAEVKAQADLIAQQQRLVQCLADPKNCTP